MLFRPSATWVTFALSATLLCGALPAQASEGKSGHIEGKVTNLPKGLESSVVIFLQGEGLPRTVPKKRMKVSQKARQFDPQILAVVAGAVVEFPNYDKIMHNVFSPTEGSSFDLGYYKEGESKAVTLTRPGVVSVYCNIHPNMVATVLVLSNDLFTHPAADGSFELKGVPPGDYEIAIWSSFSGAPKMTSVTVAAGEAVKQELRIPNAVKNEPHTRKDGLPYGRYK